MAALIELTGDVEKGPGYALLKVAPFAVDGPVRLSVMSNQGKTPYLTANGQWTSETAWIDLADVQSNEDGSLSAFLGPLLVDPIAMQPANVRLKAVVVSGPEKAESLLRISRVLASAAGAPPTLSAPEPIPVQPPPPPIPELEPLPEPAPDIKIEPEMRIEREERPLPPHPAKKSIALPLIIGLVLIIGAAGLAGAWLAGLLPFGQQQQASSSGSSSSGFDGVDAVKAFLQKNPSAADAHAAALKLQAENKADFALLIYQYAARQGDSASAKALAEMYDPDTWSKEKSPIPAADAETAAYWYEPAAKAGDVGAMRQLGKIMRALSPTGSQNDKGLEWLKKAADAGDPDAKKLIEGK